MARRLFRQHRSAVQPRAEVVRRAVTLRCDLRHSGHWQQQRDGNSYRYGYSNPDCDAEDDTDTTASPNTAAKTIGKPIIVTDRLLIAAGVDRPRLLVFGSELSGPHVLTRRRRLRVSERRLQLRNYRIPESHSHWTFVILPGTTSASNGPKRPMVVFLPLRETL